MTAFEPMPPAAPILAIFVGGRSRRMGVHKGLLPVPGGSEPILDALVRRGREVGLLPVLVGEATPYDQLARGVARIDDEPPGAGPLAGLHAALRHALRAGSSQVIAIACDMPHVSPEALRQVRDQASDAPVVAPRRGTDAPWEPMLARYDAARLADLVEQAIVQGRRSFQQLFSLAEIEPLPLSSAIERALEDWDTPQDVAR
jgi:molybdopterin-guanine dinucleotide biosynthesis protein A